MIKYYAYYSYGGFKDMMVGSQADTAVRTYYLPLVDAGIDTDSVKLDLPKIKIIGEEDESETLPSGVGRIVYNGGYYLFFSRNLNGHCVLVVRDIIGTEKDENGRTIPFVMELSGDLDDAPVLATLAAAFLKDPNAPALILGPLFHYDPEFNGLCFENKQLSQRLEAIAQNVNPQVVITDKGTLNLLNIPKDTVLAATIQGKSSQLLEKLGLSSANTVVLRLTEIQQEKMENIEIAHVEEKNDDIIVDLGENNDDSNAIVGPVGRSVNNKILTYAIVGGGIAVLAIAAACIFFFKR